MNTVIALERRGTEVPPVIAARAKRERIADDRAMLRTAAELTRDILPHNKWLYWTDLIASALLGYGALVAAILIPVTGWAILAAIVAVLALYRAGSFIHELTHFKPSAVPGFHIGWNLIAGIPLLLPSFMYEGVHQLHHARTRYGTSEDPEYLPLALMKPWTLPLFILVSALGPIALLFRYGVLSSLSLLIPAVRKLSVERYSSLSINPGFRRRAPEGAARIEWLWQEALTSVWAIALLTMVATGVIPLRAFLIGLAILSASMVINQVRTLVAHLWENEGEAMTVTAQYLDTVNVPPPSMLPMLWAPVGLRYHALHHLIPALPYHALGEAHRRISAALDAESPYHAASYPGLPGLVAKIARSTMGVR